MFIHSSDAKLSVLGFAICEKAGDYCAAWAIKSPTIIAVFTSGHHLALRECVVAFAFHAVNSLENQVIDVGIGGIEPGILPKAPEYILDIVSAHTHGRAYFHQSSNVTDSFNKCVDRNVVEATPILGITSDKTRMDAAFRAIERYTVIAVLFNRVIHSSVCSTQHSNIDVGIVRAGSIEQLPFNAVFVEKTSQYRLVLNRAHHRANLLNCSDIAERVDNLLDGHSNRRLCAEHRARYRPRTNFSPHSNHPQINTLRTAQAA